MTPVNKLNIFLTFGMLLDSITKKLLKASKEKGCEIIASWIKAICKHLYWYATSTWAGFNALIAAKWNMFLRYVANKHTNYQLIIFNLQSWRTRTKKVDKDW